MKETPDDRRAMEGALRLLKFRGRSRRELATYLTTKKFSEDIVDAVVARLAELGLVDDAKLAGTWVEGGRQRGWGVRRIKQFLLKRGIAARDVDLALEQTPEYSEALPEADRAWETLSRRAARILKNPAARHVLYSRLSGYLERQGFEIDVARAAVQRFLKENPSVLKEDEKAKVNPSESGTDNP